MGEIACAYSAAQYFCGPDLGPTLNFFILLVLFISNAWLIENTLFLINGYVLHSLNGNEPTLCLKSLLLSSKLAAST